MPAGGDRLYVRTVGEGPPVVVVHGGPDFDHFYLLPELDRLAESFRLVYYDQRGRGRGRSAAGVRPEDVDVDSEVADLDRVRRHFGLDSVALLGHSWGGLLAMEYAARHPGRVSHLVLANTAPASGEDARALRQHLLSIRTAGDVERMAALRASPAYRAGNLESEAEYYRMHFRPALRRPQLLEQVVERLRAHFTEESVLTARAIEARLYDQTWGVEGYDLLPRLRELEIPTLVLHAEHDFIHVALVARIAEAMPRARLVVLPECGHFASLESPDAFCEAVTVFLEEGPPKRASQ